MKKIVIFVTSALIALTCPQAAAADASIEAVPTAWRLENYNSGMDLAVWFSGSSCSNGKLTFPPTATNDHRNRFYSLILSSKAMGKKIGVFYETSTGNCQMTSFYVE